MKELSECSTYSRMALIRQRGFSLIEVVLAIGIFLVTVLALVGLLGPTLQSVDEVEKTDEVSSIVNTVNSFLQNSPSIAPSGVSKFNTIFNAVAGDGYATIFVFRQYNTNDSVSVKIGFWGETSDTILASDVATGSMVKAAGPVYRVVLTPSSVTPTQYLVGGSPVTRDPGKGVYVLTPGLDIDSYMEGSFAMELRIYAEDPSVNFDGDKLPPYVTGSDGVAAETAILDNLKDLEPIFTYNTAIVR
jgi:prepilin-type N-terminal cleavage/methylation domain-containing protein